MIVVWVAILIALGAFALLRVGRKQPVREVLRVAKANRGRITAEHVLQATRLRAEVVTRTLDELTLAGTCQLVVGEKGTHVYYFYEFEQ